MMKKNEQVEQQLLTCDASDVTFRVMEVSTAITRRVRF
jgi:hypothetical protein